MTVHTNYIITKSSICYNDYIEQRLGVASGKSGIDWRKFLKKIKQGLNPNH